MAGGAREQVSRLLALVPYLQRRTDLTLSEVAAEFGVSPRQIHADLRVLWMCGLPGLTPDRMVEVDMEALEVPLDDDEDDAADDDRRVRVDPGGTVRIDNVDFLPRPVRLGSSEAAALMVALQALGEAGTGESREVVDRVLAKLEEAASAGPLPTAQLAPRPAEGAEHARELVRAVAADKQVRLGYYVPVRDETTERVVDPVALLTRDGHDYLDAWCHLAEDRRLFRLDRVERVEVLDAARTRPDLAPRDLAEGLFAASPDDALATLRLAPHARWVAEYHPVEALRELGDDACEVDLRYADPRWVVRLALRLGPAVEVVAPPELREQVAAEAAQTLALYDA